MILLGAQVRTATPMPAEEGHRGGAQLIRLLAPVAVIAAAAVTATAAVTAASARPRAGADPRAPRPARRLCSFRCRRHGYWRYGRSFQRWGLGGCLGELDGLEELPYRILPGLHDSEVPARNRAASPRRRRGAGSAPR